MNDDFLYAGALATLEPVARIRGLGTLVIRPPQQAVRAAPGRRSPCGQSAGTDLAACERGERPDRRSFLDTHEAIAPVLAQCLSSLACLQAAGRHFDVAEIDETGPYVPAGMLLQPPCRLALPACPR